MASASADGAILEISMSAAMGLYSAMPRLRILSQASIRQAAIHSGSYNQDFSGGGFIPSLLAVWSLPK